VYPLWKTVWSFLRKLRLKLPYNPAIPPLGIYLKTIKTLIQKDICTPMFTAAPLIVAKIRKQPKCPSINEWTKKTCSTYAMEYYSTTEMNEILPFVTTCKGLKSIVLSKMSQRRHILYHFTHM